MMRFSVMPMSACASACVIAMMAFADSAEARERTYHRHTLSSKHSHHHAGRIHRHVRYAHRFHRRHYARLVQPAAPEFSPFADRFWQQQPATPFAPQTPTYRPQADRNGIPSPFSALVSAHAQANGIPESLVHRVVMRESRYNPRAVSRGNYGIMQIRLGTARAMGYTGSAAGLLDANTNMTYAVRYLAGAYRAAGGNHNRAVALYAGGYYYQAKRQGFSPYAMATSVPAGMTMTAPYAAPTAARASTLPVQTRAYTPPVQNFGPTTRYE